MPLDTESQFKFLIACIKHSSNGKVDFNEVAKECEIVTKGAAAKRYERLMKAHGIANSPGPAPKTPVKKDKGATTPRSSAKKRKLEAVDSDAGDIDEPAIKGEVKSEVKSEVKFEKATRMKTEHGNGGIAAMAPAFSVPQPEPPAPANPDDDDEVYVISSNQKRDNNVLVYGGDHHHSHTPAQTIPGIRSFDYAANLGYPTQAIPMTPTMMPRAGSGNHLPYGFPRNSTWVHHHDSSGFFWPEHHIAHQSSEAHKEGHKGMSGESMVTPRDTW
ncbi:hypothetical protein BJ170DRAFT_726708 [Xylariales sp. AK1849]|nr:hypothetical protein BJ170DRAFT_726708 [Xylariales sp. AK1849]